MTPSPFYIQEKIMIQGLQNEKEKLDFLSTKCEYIGNNTPIQTGETYFISKETNTIIQIQWARYGKYLELDYWVEALQ